MKWAAAFLDAAALEEYCALLETTDTLPLQITGSSMVPFLVPGRDSVLLMKPAERLRRGDIALYRRTGGALVLHRVCRCRNGLYTMCGDAQTELEPGIRHEQVHAVVCAAVRKGRSERPGTFWWGFFAHIWPCIIPLRPFFCRLYAKLRRN